MITLVRWQIVMLRSNCLPKRTAVLSVFAFCLLANASFYWLVKSRHTLISPAGQISVCLTSRHGSQVKRLKETHGQEERFHKRKRCAAEPKNSQDTEFVMQPIFHISLTSSRGYAFVDL